MLKTNSSTWVLDSYPYSLLLGFPSGPVVKNLLAMLETQETQIQSLGGEDPLEESIKIQSNILAWKIPWTEDPGVLQPVGSPGVRHD